MQAALRRIAGRLGSEVTGGIKKYYFTLFHIGGKVLILQLNVR